MKKRQVPFHKPSPWKKVAIHQNGTLSELEQHLTLISDNDQRDDGYDAAAPAAAAAVDDDDDGDDDDDDDEDGDVVNQDLFNYGERRMMVIMMRKFMINN